MTTDPAANRTGSRGSVARLVAAYWLPAALYVALIFMVSGKPFLTPPVRFPYVDKVAHLAEYGVLGLLLSRALRATAPGMRGTSRAAWAIAGGVLVGASDEWYQSFVPGRQSSVVDFVADTVGVTLAQALPRGFLPE